MSSYELIIRTKYYCYGLFVKKSTYENENNVCTH